MFHLSPLSLLPSLLKLSDFDKVPGVLETGAVCVSTQILSGCHLVHSTLHSRSLSLSLSLSPLFSSFLSVSVPSGSVGCYLLFFLCGRLVEFSTRKCCSFSLYRNTTRRRGKGMGEEGGGKRLLVTNACMFPDDYFS